MSVPLEALQSVILGIVEGITEFLPVSSTFHLRLAEKLMGIDLNSGFWETYTVVIQIGAILTLPVYFWRRILKLCGNFPRGDNGRDTIFTHPLSLTMFAFVVTAAISLALIHEIKSNLENFIVMGAALLIGGAVMWAVDALCTNPRINNMSDMGLPRALWIGLCQVASAVLPGTSRSMSTIAAGQVASMSRPTALEFSFFLSMPTMGAATLYQLKKAIFPKPGQEMAPVNMDALKWMLLLIGTVVSFIVALMVVAWFMQWVRKHGFVPFAVYRIILGAIVLWVAHTVPSWQPGPAAVAMHRQTPHTLPVETVAATAGHDKFFQSTATPDGHGG